MKKVLLIVSVALLSFQNQAQSLALKGGLNMANMSSTSTDSEGVTTDTDDDNKYNLGFHFGALGELPLSDVLHLEAGVLLTTKGSKVKIDEEIFGIPFNITATTNVMYLDIPVSLKAKFELNRDSYFYLSGGAYFGLALAGTTRVKADVAGEVTDDSEAIDFGKGIDLDTGEGDDADMSSTDFGLTFGAGLEMKGLIFGLYYDLGLANVSPANYTEYQSMKHSGLKLSLGYRIGWDN